MPAVPKLQILTIERLLDPNGPKLMLPLFATDGVEARASTYGGKGDGDAGEGTKLALGGTTATETAFAATVPRGKRRRS